MQSTLSLILHRVEAGHHEALGDKARHRKSPSCTGYRRGWFPCEIGKRVSGKFSIKTYHFRRMCILPDESKRTKKFIIK